MLRCIVSPIISVHMWMWENWHRSPTRCSCSDHVQLSKFCEKYYLSWLHNKTQDVFLGGYPFRQFALKWHSINFGVFLYYHESSFVVLKSFLDFAMKTSYFENEKTCMSSHLRWSWYTLKVNPNKLTVNTKMKNT